VSQRLPAPTFARPLAVATGRAGDVFVCQFVVHRVMWTPAIVDALTPRY
jgi:hypothetical protein